MYNLEAMSTKHIVPDYISFHVTIAVATFDWTLAGILNVASKSILTKVEDYRKGIKSKAVQGDMIPYYGLFCCNYEATTAMFFSVTD